MLHLHWRDKLRGIASQLDDRIIAQRRDCFQAHVAAPLNRPFIVLFEQQRANEARDRVLVGEDADHIGAPLDLTVEPFDRIDGMDFRPVIFGKPMKASTSVSASSMKAASFGTFGRN